MQEPHRKGVANHPGQIGDGQIGRYRSVTVQIGDSHRTRPLMYWMYPGSRFSLSDAGGSPKTGTVLSDNPVAIRDRCLSPNLLSTSCQYKRLIRRRSR